MSSELGSSIRRREFLKKAGTASALSLVDLRLNDRMGRIVIVADNKIRMFKAGRCNGHSKNYGWQSNPAVYQRSLSIHLPR